MHLSSSYPEVSTAKKGLMDRGAIEHLSRRQKLSWWIKELSRSYRDCGKKKLKKLLKNRFSRREKHRHECNQTCNSTKDPNNILNSQKHLLTKKNVKHINPKTHTHTKQVEPILYFENKLRQFSEHTLTQVFLVMAKSHCTCSCIKSSKE